MSDTENRSSVEDVKRVSSDSLQNHSSDPHWPIQPAVHQFADAGALGLCGFCMTAFVTGCYFAGTKSIAIPNVLVSLATFYGGTIEVLCGIWELAKGNTYNGTLHTSLGSLWLSLASIYIPSFGIIEAYAEAPEQLTNALGFYFLGWCVFAVVIFLASLKSTYPVIATLVVLLTALLCLSGGFLSGSANALKAGGILLIVTSFFGWYIVFGFIATKQNSYIRTWTLPVHIFGKKN
ncbi:uncharacterized protein SPAPADRAFT_63280 [Spathaspora passalidarum NRRL Y-27907]|uniref:Uncharacterized protein n=1 Tax=Spathaspora passalidarum (strain NRRL Y-27907 / 11-Y1) TaxID=619300 RepID=G3AU68_SPAPN|nr:uncharacterized protein SPAPADRAFT_63280 [Spathaspora passalidarum NRRL Y-27907]EGW30444.1 hypothetical protein SPAPADRAFT_63280 [Spathaspora passalidarum NRRL Y-27907]